MYFIGIIVFLVFLILINVLNSTVMALVDLPSLIVILALSIPTLLASGLLPDFFKGFKLMGQKVNYYSKLDLERILEANNLAVKSFLLSGSIGMILGFVGVLRNLTNPSLLGPNFAVAMLTVLYSLIFISLILPIKSRVRTIMKTMEIE